MKSVLLIIDDNKDIVEFLKEVLSEEYDTLEANNGKEALDLLTSEVVHLIICDVLMPVMDGFTFCKKMKSNYELSHVPIILLTSRNTLQSKIKGLELGADVYIEKPFYPTYLKAQIASLLQNRLKVKDYFANSPLVNIKSVAYTKLDELFVEKLNEYINNNLENTELDVMHLAAAVNISRPTLYRKINVLMNLSPRELINITRLKKAAELLVIGEYQLSTIASMVGFSSQSYFSQSFLRQFGLTPTEFVTAKQQENKTSQKPIF